MDQAALTVLMLVVGIALGAAVTILISMALRAGRRAAALQNPVVPDGIQSTLEALEAGSIILDPSNNVIWASSANAALGVVTDGVVHPTLAEAATRMREQEQEQELQLELPVTNSGPKFLRVRVTLVGSRFTLILVTDQTEAVRLDTMRREFVANISHELKTPIGAISLLAEAIEQSSDDAEVVAKFAGRMRQESRRLSKLTQEIIELSRLQVANPLADGERVDLAEVVTLASDQLRVAADAKQIELVVGGEAHAVVKGDGALLTMMLHNIIANAVQYSSPKSRVGIGLAIKEGRAEIAVTDTGVGIPRAEQERIFERFYRVDGSRARNTGGTGLGLSIVKHAVHNHGGEVRVWSQPGLGSTFTVSLPLADNSELPQTVPDLPRASAGRKSAPLKSRTQNRDTRDPHPVS